jgi:hypothetical protein
MRVRTSSAADRAYRAYPSSFRIKAPRANVEIASPFHAATILSSRNGGGRRMRAGPRVDAE